MFVNISFNDKRFDDLGLSNEEIKKLVRSMIDDETYFPDELVTIVGVSLAAANDAEPIRLVR